MNNNFSSNCCAAARFRAALRSSGAALGIAAVCLLLPISVGCHTGGAAACHHPPFEQLEQGCFGYEPTVWRSLPGDCQQALRLVPDEVVTAKPAATAEPTMAAEPPVAKPEEDVLEPLLDEVPDRGGPLPRIVAPPEETPEGTDAPPAEKPPAVSPDEVPAVPPAETEVPAVPPAQPEVPAVPPTKTEAPVEPSTPPIEEPKPTPEQPGTERSSAFPAAVPVVPVVVPAVVPARIDPDPSLHLAPVIRETITRASHAGSGVSSESADALFRTVSSALEETAAKQPKSDKHAAKRAASTLSKFISY